MSTATLAGLVALLGGVVLVVGVATARRPPQDVLGLQGYYDRWSAGHGGFDPRSSVWVRGWLRGVHAAALPLSRRGVRPDALTLAGVWSATVLLPLAAAGGSWPLLAVPVVVVSGVLDNLDGAVAVMTGRSTRFGAVLDALGDRVADVLYLLALGLLGAPGWLVAAAAAVVVAQEYVRARAGQAGMAEVGVVTVAERPTRVIVAAFTLAACGVLAAQAGPLATVGVAVLLALQAVGLVQVLLAARRGLA